ncbi:virulence protein [Anaerotignum lactatifermentans]|uniref:virulence protein n=1 Tax=Anaerotignum lactatifermentans TaxID=160404 RepID=UPI001875243C|nr:virulence protein [Anaerotignum lactatifermentans]MBE5075404.1 virulence protein [Anaerotignum lactatifermentans]
MEIRYNVTGAKRKELVKVIANATGARAEYKFMPTCNYEIDYFTVTKYGTLLFDDRADSEEVERVLEAISAAGFECEPQDGGEQPFGEETKEAAEAADTAPQETNLGGPRQTNRFVGERTSSEVNELSASDGSERYGACEDALTVEIPLDKVAVGNLAKLLDAKGNLIRKALGITDLRIEVLEDRVAFPWFSQVDTDSAAAYTHFISALCEMSRNAKRVTATEKPVDNEKYAFRCFLLRLGFIGSEYKAERKILLKNLTGSSAFKDGGVNHEVSE